jgi:hypothetical protein
MPRCRTIAAALALGWALTGCATILNAGPDEIQVTSAPAGAEVKLNGIPKGKTPVTIQAERDQRCKLEVSLEGHRTWRGEVYTELNGITMLNLLFFPGFIVDFATGDIEKFELSAVHASLVKEAPSAPEAPPVEASAPRPKPESAPKPAPASGSAAPPGAAPRPFGY